VYAKLRARILPQLIPTNSKLLVAISGGPDSVALTHILWRYAQEQGANLSLVLSHVHHGVRVESDQEVLLVEKLASELGVPCFVHRFNAKEYTRKVGLSFQEAARAWRYARFQEDAEREGCTHIATAHHLGDQAETIIYRLLRGSGTAGLGGIHPNKAGLIRPLLTVTKEEILEYCHKESLAYAIDQTNMESIYVRNRIRLELLPELKRNYNPRILETLGRTAELMRWDEDYIGTQAMVAWRRYCLRSSADEVVLGMAIFQEPKAILSRLLRQAASVVSNDPRGLGYTYVDKIMECKGALGWTQNLPGLQVVITDQGIHFCKQGWLIQSEVMAKIKAKAKTKTKTKIEDGVPGSGIVLTPGKWNDLPELGVRVGLFTTIPRTVWELEGAKEIALLEPESLHEPEPLVCRTRQSGDEMWFHKVGHKSLRKIFQELRILPKARETWPIIAIGSEVLWVPGLRQSDKYKSHNQENELFCIVISLN